MCVKIRNFLIFPHIKIKKNFLHPKTFFQKKDFCPKSFFTKKDFYQKSFFTKKFLRYMKNMIIFVTENCTLNFKNYENT